MPAVITLTATGLQRSTKHKTRSMVKTLTSTIRKNLFLRYVLL